MKKHLAILTLDFKPDPGGVQEYLFQIAQILGKLYRVTVVTPITGEITEPIHFTRRFLTGKSPLLIRQHLKELQPTHVLVGHAHPALLAGAWLWKDYAVAIYGNDFLAAQRRWHRPLFNYLLRKGNPIIAVSANTATVCHNKIGARSIVAYPGTDPARFAPLPERSPRPHPILLTMGRLVPRKGIDTMLQALPIILRETAVTYQIGGSGPDLPRLQQITIDLGIASSVQFLGRVPDEKLPQMYADADIFVMPNRAIAAAGSLEGFGIVFLEANASGVPVIAGRSGGAVEAVRDGETGLLVPPEDPAALARAVLALLKDPQQRRRMGENGRRWVVEEMNWEATAQRIRKILKLP